MAAFAFSALRFRFRGPLFGLLLVTLIIPFQVVLVPNFILFRLLPHPFRSDGGVRVLRPPVPVPRAPVRPVARDVDHPVPGGPRPELHPLPAAPAPVPIGWRRSRSPPSGSGSAGPCSACCS